MATEYDLVILGGGTGGYVAAIRASQLGLKTAVVEKRKLGGTCLHKGCIPSKALLRSAEVYRTAKKADEFGVVIPEVGLRFSQVQSRKQKIIDQLHNGVKHLMKKERSMFMKESAGSSGRRFFPRTRGRFPSRWRTGMKMRCSYRKTSSSPQVQGPGRCQGLSLTGKAFCHPTKRLNLSSFRLPC